MNGKIPTIRRPRALLGEILLAERRRHSWSCSDVARRAGMMPSRVHAYECGDLVPGKRAMPRLLRAVDLPEQFASLLTALARFDYRLSHPVRAVDEARAELAKAARILVRQGVDLARKAHELRGKESVA